VCHPNRFLLITLTHPSPKRTEYMRVWTWEKDNISYSSVSNLESEKQLLCLPSNRHIWMANNLLIHCLCFLIPEAFINYINDVLNLQLSFPECQCEIHHLEVESRQTAHFKAAKPWSSLCQKFIFFSRCLPDVYNKITTEQQQFPHNNREPVNWKKVLANKVQPELSC
jgi:hypothetical protein